MEDLAPEDLVDEWSDVSTSSLGPGARLGRYELLIPIAYGGMARVWAARLHGQRGFSKTVAIKTILPHLAHNPEFERMFLDEARIAAGVHHPNVTEIYELGEEGSVLYLVMEWVNGDSLMHVLRGPGGKTAAPIEARLAARIVADACAGLHAAHELTDDDSRLLNVVHRDVSPHNILVSLEGTVKMTDFGVAKALGQTHQETAAGQVKGKVAYMAPEQIGGINFDRRADVFAMGCVLYETATGVQAFRGGNDPQVMQAVLRGTYEPPSSLVKGFPAELAAVIDRALAPEPSARFATAERMRVAIEEWLAKSGGIVTSTQVGSLVRQRLGASLDRRREHVKAAMASLQPEGTRDLGHTPSQPQPGQSHSGVVSTGAGQPGSPAAAMMRPRSPSLPQVSPPSLPPALPPPLPPPLPARAGTAPAGPSGARYVVAAVAGVVFALVVGGIGLALWLSTHGKTGDATATATAAAAPVSSVPASAALTAPTAPAAPSHPAVTAPVPVAPAAASVPAAATATPALPASAAPTTIDVTDLPTAKPTWPTAPAGAVAPAPARPSAASAAPALPANPY
jgi:serine/threonine-protein kinase